MKKTPTAADPLQPERVPGPETGKRAAPKSTTRGRGQAKQHDSRGRETRAQETHNELFERVDENRDYVRPTSTEAPEPRAGMKQRWIRVGFEGKIDEKNLSRKLREGWRARAANTVPRGFQVPRVSSGRFAGTIMVEGLLLCEMPIKLAQKRAASVRAATKLRTDAVNENLMRVNEGARGGFGPIKKGEKSELKPTKPAPVKGEAETEEVDLT